MRNNRFTHILHCTIEPFLNVRVFLPPVSSVPVGGAQDAGGALVGPSL